MPLTLEPAAVMLKKHTAERHRDVEKAMNPRIENIKSYADYAALLKTFYGFYHPLQDTISQILSSDDLPDLHERKHSVLILEDLKSIGQEEGYIPICNELPEISTKAQAFGCLYVIEGSTLGGRVISKWLQKNQFIDLQVEQLQFFNGYNEQTGTKWKAFSDALNEVQDIPNLITAANETFYLFQNWITTVSE